jgi:4-nitrophenyl phosphatase
MSPGRAVPCDLVLCDLDGVVWLDDSPIPGSAAAVGRLREAGCRVLFVTNFSFGRVAEMEAKLSRHGIEATGDVVTSAMAAASLVEPGERVLVAAGPGVVDAVEARGAVAVPTRSGARPVVDAVVVGFHRSFDFDVLDEAAAAVRAGARFIGTNDDATYPIPGGALPGSGALVAAVATAAGRAALVAGKPHEPMAALIRSATGVDPHRMVMVGDRGSTDGRFARTLGCPFALVLTGVTTRDAAAAEDADLVCDDLASVVDRLLAGHT